MMWHFHEDAGHAPVEHERWEEAGEVGPSTGEPGDHLAGPITNIWEILYFGITKLEIFKREPNIIFKSSTAVVLLDVGDVFNHSTLQWISKLATTYV